MLRQRPISAARPLTAVQRGRPRTGHFSVLLPFIALITAGMRSRQVQDKSYYMGLLRAHMSELNAELKRLTTDARKLEEDRQHFASYEKK